MSGNENETPWAKDRWTRVRVVDQRDPENTVHDNYAPAAPVPDAAPRSYDHNRDTQIAALNRDLAETQFRVAALERDLAETRFWALFGFLLLAGACCYLHFVAESVDVSTTPDPNPAPAEASP